MKKVYISGTGGILACYVQVGGKAKLIALNNFDLTFGTDDAELQKAIEASKFYKEEKIKLLRTEGEEKKEAGGETPEPPKNQVKEYPEVTDLNGAIEVLTGTPYKVAKSSLKSPAEIEKKAAEKGVSFPNLFNDDL